MIEDFKAAAAGAKWNESFYQVLTEQPGKDSWPITGATFILMHVAQDKPANAAATLKFFDWAYTQGDKMADELDYVPLPASVKDLVRKQWAAHVKDAAGKVVEVRCTYDPATRGGDAPDGRKVKGTIHWVSEAQAGDVEVRLYDRLFAHEDMKHIPEGSDWRTLLNPGSLQVIRGKVEPALLALPAGTRVTMRFGFDNTTNNVRNPFTPPRVAHFGDASVRLRLDARRPRCAGVSHRGVRASARRPCRPSRPLARRARPPRWSL